MRITDAKPPPKVWYRTKWFFFGVSILGVLFVYWIAR